MARFDLSDFEWSVTQPLLPPGNPGRFKALDHIDEASLDVVVMDPPYYDNVMYAELSDFFYVWLKRTAGHVVPELFTRNLTDKDNEAVANPAKFADRANRPPRYPAAFRRSFRFRSECHQIRAF